MDSISRLICEDLNLRVYTVQSLDTAKKIIGLHECGPNASVALGRVLNSAALLSAGLKPGSVQSVSVKFSGEGYLREVMAQADAAGNIRGYVANPEANPLESETGISFSKAIGAGFLTVIRDLSLKEPHTSLLPLTYGDVAKDMSLFFAQSDQIPSAMILAFEPDIEGVAAASGGILVQSFPNTQKEAIEEAERLINSFPVPLGKMLLDGRDVNEAAEEILGGLSLKLVSAQNIRAACRCSKDILRAALSGVQKKELLSMINEDHGARITCSFCKKVYIFNEDELRDIMNEKKQIPS